ncbi:G1/S-specific cyclin-E-like [Anopheles albimanus]|uniref:G1/S-specific cyclin-E-like n=1 Tax=Anopheles albimanus TaxID=7167 RepID=UPI0016413715|nr:G1/S-specific cyclin-E-like [Anopheles albimanus]
MDSRNGSNYGSKVSSTETRRTQPNRNGRKRKITSEDAKDSEGLQPSAKRSTVRARRSPHVASSAPSSVLPTSANSSTATASSSSTEQPSMPVLAVATTSGSSSSNGAMASNFVQDFTSDTQSSSECFSSTTEFDLYQLVSPASVSNGGVLSPLCEAATLVGSDAPSWLPKGVDSDCLPHHRLTAKAAADNPAASKAALVSSSCYLTPSYKQRSCPLPSLSWVDSTEMWKLMCRKDDLSWLDREPNMFDNHPGIVPRMRAILVDWLSEVCEVYKMHRETYYLAVDYIDRFLSRKKEQKKTHLQLLGITALFVAAKVEEIYPPKIGEFAYVTDGACTEEDILDEELVLLSVLDWNINPVTVIGWLGMYMQVNVTAREPENQLRYVRAGTGTTGATTQIAKKVPPPSATRDAENDENQTNNWSSVPCTPNKHSATQGGRNTSASKTDDAFVYPQFSGMEFAHTAQLIDLCVLDLGFANFKYSVIAAAAISHTFDRKTATFVSGLNWEEIAPCAKWMESFFAVISEQNAQCPLTFLESNEQLKYSHGLSHVCPNLVGDSSHIIQTHTTSMNMLELVAIKMEEIESSERMVKQEASPAPIGITLEDGILTPPASNRKSLETVSGPYHHPLQPSTLQQESQLHPVPGHGVIVQQIVLK